jgi:hypothetical protein
VENAKKIDGFVLELELAVPELGNNTADVERLKEAVKKKFDIDSLSVPLSALRNFPFDLRMWNHRVKIVLFRGKEGWFAIAVENPDKQEPI